jgi:histidinol-phosphate aminotransferase
LLIIDECFADFANLNHYEMLGIQEHLIYVKSYSKCFGVAGARIAVTLASERITNYLSRWRPESAISGYALQLLEFLVSQREELSAICTNIAQSREKFVEAMQEIQPSWQALPSGGNYVNFFLPASYNTQTVINKVKQLGYDIRDVSNLSGLESCVRFGIAHWDIMKRLSESLKAIE